MCVCVCIYIYIYCTPMTPFYGHYNKNYNNQGWLYVQVRVFLCLT